jgi:VWFA-related protein
MAPVRTSSLFLSFLFAATLIAMLLSSNLSLRFGNKAYAAEQSSSTPVPAVESHSVAQGAQASPGKPNGSSIKVSTRLVQASVVVQDKHGRPVAGLTKEDFTILDDRQPQTIAVFSASSNQVQNTPAVTQAPDTFTNRATGTRAPSNVAVILLDGLNTEFPDQAYARQQIIKFLLQIRPEDRVALYTLGSELKILHDFTSDASTLLATLKRYKGQLSSLLTSLDSDQSGTDFGMKPGTPEDLLDGFFQKNRHRGPSTPEQAFLWNERAHRTLLALLQIAYHTSSLPGRKTLIWVSGSFPLIPSYMSSGIVVPDERLILADDFEKAAQALNNSTLVVYPVDAHGLTVTRPDFANVVIMKTIAENTGGRAFYNSNDLRRAIRQAVDESSSTYELGYYPAAEKWDGRFHRIQVRVKRKGLTLRTRGGYLAAVQPKITPEIRNEFVSRALATLVDDDRLHITLRVIAATQDQQKQRTLNTSITMDPQELSLKQQDGMLTGVVELLYIQIDGEGKVADATKQRFLLNLPPAAYESSQDHFTFAKDIPIRSNASKLRVVLCDSEGQAGGVVVPLERFFPPSPSATQ